MSNPKRGRPRTWLGEREFVKKYRILTRVPPRCICGSLNYRFTVLQGEVHARCNSEYCRAMIVYDDDNDRWVFARSDGRSYIR